MNKQIILITGASTGMGKATAIKLQEEGCQVYATARRTEKMEELTTLGIQTRYLDVTNEESASAVVSEILETHGRIDVLVNNAGYGSYGALEDVPLSEAKNQLEVNLLGAARMCQMVIPTMRKQKHGRIINISSIGGKAHEPLGAWYHASKYGLEGLSDSLRTELAPFGIDVVVIQPGSIESEWTDIALKKLVTFSKGGAYEPYIHQEAFFGNPGAVTIVSNAIWTAVKSKKPKTRYAVGPMAKLTIFSRWLLSDRMMDCIITQFTQYNNK